VAPENCVVVEDAVQGIKAAKNAGMKNVALQSKHNQCLDLSLADETITNLNQLQALIDKWNESL
jgi:beta-phosphoglucomutase-like phosphatase (HAD superfamily)